MSTPPRDHAFLKLHDLEDKELDLGCSVNAPPRTASFAASEVRNSTVSINATPRFSDAKSPLEDDQVNRILVDCEFSSEDEEDDLLDEAFQNASPTRTLARRSPLSPNYVSSPPRRRLPPDSLQLNQSSLDSTIAMRRVSSTPVPRPKVQTSNWPKPPLVVSPVKRPPSTSPNDLSFKPYEMRRQISLPVTSEERFSFMSSSDSDVSSSFPTEYDHEVEPMLNSPATPQTERRTISDSDTRMELLKSNLSTFTCDETENLASTGTANGFDHVRQRRDETVKLESALSPISQDKLSRRRTTSFFKDVQEDQPAEPCCSSRGNVPFLQRQHVRYILYLSTFAIFGSTVRVYVGRFFGADCDSPDTVNDFLSPLARQICVTASGRTLQTGGALFLDLPANILGSFIMGLITSLKPGIWPPLPWFHADHPLQQNDALHVALRTGFCGSLTTFSSWNAQMVVMVDGTSTVLGSQPVPALFGYVIGLLCAVASFSVGTHVSAWLNRWKNPHIFQEDDMERQVVAMETFDDSNHQNEESVASQRSQQYNHPHLASSPLPRFVVFMSLGDGRARMCTRIGSLLSSTNVPFVILVILITLYAVGDGVMGIPFYRSMWMSAIFSPPGALLRWYLSKWQSRLSSDQSKRFGWVPWGTFIANIVASVVSALLLAIETRYYLNDESNFPWAISLSSAIRVGFAGSLSTVSTLVKEIVEFQSKYPHHAKAYHYAVSTIVCSAVLSFCVYSPIVRWS